MTLTTRLLPLAMVAAWIFGLVVPLLDSGAGGGPRLVMTSLGDPSAPLATRVMPFVPVGVIVFVLALTAWLPRPGRVWSWAAMGAALCLALTLASLLGDPPVAIWDGIDEATGRPIGGMSKAGPTISSFTWFAGCTALFVAGARSMSRSTRPDRAAKNG